MAGRKAIRTYMSQRHFDHFSQLLDLFLASTDIRVRDIRLVLDFHHLDRFADFQRQRQLDLVGPVLHPRKETSVP